MRCAHKDKWYVFLEIHNLSNVTVSPQLANPDMSEEFAGPKRYAKETNWYMQLQQLLSTINISVSRILLLKKKNK